jgi:hypothetical protein
MSRLLQTLNAPTVLAEIDGVTAIHQLDEDPD